MKVYTASKSRHGPHWLSLRVWGKPLGIHVNATWIDEHEVGATVDFADLWRRCTAEPAEADVLLLYREPGELLKDALVELGVAVGLGKRVLLVGDFDGVGSWTALGFPHVDTLDEARDVLERWWCEVNG